MCTRFSPGWQVACWCKEKDQGLRVWTSLHLGSWEGTLGQDIGRSPAWNQPPQLLTHSLRFPPPEKHSAFFREGQSIPFLSIIYIWEWVNVHLWLVGKAHKAYFPNFQVLQWINPNVWKQMYYRPRSSTVKVCNWSVCPPQAQLGENIAIHSFSNEMENEGMTGHSVQ